MGILRIPVLLIFAAFLTSCAAHVPVFETQDDVSVFETPDNVPTTTAQPDRTPTARVISETKKPKPPATKSAIAESATQHEDTVNSTALNVGSPQKWKKERAEEERKEQKLKQVIEGICRGC